MNYDLITPVVYSHTEYSSVLQIQTDYTDNYMKRLLFINTPTSTEYDDIFSIYSSVHYYNDTLPYASRVLSLLDNVHTEYVLFTHDIDILLYSDHDTLNKLLNVMVTHNLDRVDLKYWEFSSNNIYVDEQITLIQQRNTSDYIYNVNPSIWKTRTLAEILHKFSDRNYRTIESMDVQSYCTKFNVFKVHKSPMLKCGYFNCVDFYKFLHISHSGKMLNLNDSNVTEFGQSYEDVAHEYRHIVSKYNLQQSPLWRQ